MSNNHRTPTQWEVFARNMSEDLDKINERLFQIFNVQPPKSARVGERKVPRPPRSPNTARRNTARRKTRGEIEDQYPTKTRQEILAEFRRQAPDCQMTNYTALPVRSSKEPARIFRPKIYQNLVYNNPRDITPVLTGETVNTGRNTHKEEPTPHICDHNGQCENCDCEDCQRIHN